MTQQSKHSQKDPGPIEFTAKLSAAGRGAFTWNSRKKAEAARKNAEPHPRQA